MFLNSLNSIERGFGLAQFDNRKNVAPLVAALPAIIAAAGTVTSAVMNKKSIDKNNALQQQLVDKANAYNTPSAQVGRFGNAGLNPYMMLGQINAGNQQSVASTQPTDYSGAVNGAVGAASALVQGLTAQSEIAKNEADMRNVNADTTTKNIRNMTELERNKAELQKQLTENAKTEADKDKIRKEIDLIDQQITQLQQINDVGLLTWDERIKAPGVQNQLNAAQAALLGSQKRGADLDNNLVKLYGAANMRAMIAKAFADARSANASASLDHANVNVAKHEANSAYWNSRGSEYGYREARRLFEYNSAYHDNVSLDYNWDKFAEAVHGGSEVTGSVNDVMNSRANRKNLKSQMRYRNAKMSKPARVPKVRL